MIDSSVPQCEAPFLERGRSRTYEPWAPRRTGFELWLASTIKVGIAVSAPGGGASTSQCHPRTIFRRALERGNLVLAEVTAREIGRVTIAEALELTALVARKQPHRYGRFAARWLCLWLEEHEKATLEDVALLVSNLRPLATPNEHAAALAILRKAAQRR